MNMFLKRKKLKITKICHFFKKKDLNYAISKFSKFILNSFFHRIKGQLEVSLGKNSQKNENREKD